MQLVVYDPYYCAGQMLSFLRDLGVLQVINKNRDFYADVEANEVPGSHCDVLLFFGMKGSYIIAFYLYLLFFIFTDHFCTCQSTISWSPTPPIVESTSRNCCNTWLKLQINPFAYCCPCMWHPNRTGEILWHLKK